MPRGGARNRSGPPPDPESGRSDQRQYSLTALPAEGFQGPAPKYPLPAPAGLDSDDEAVRQAARALRKRELELWREVWRTPQACAWSMPSEQWRQRTVAMWVRLSVRCEQADASASLLGQLHRFADQIGLTTAGLAEMGWRVAEDEVAKRAVERGAEGPTPASRARRLRAVGEP
jgi:hypothetical protein